MSTVAAHVATSAVKNWMSAYVRSAKNVSAVHMIVSAKTELRPNSLSRATVPVALIYHNIRYGPCSFIIYNLIKKFTKITRWC